MGESNSNFKAVDKAHFWYGQILIDLPSLQYAAENIITGANCHSVRNSICTLSIVAKNLVEGTGSHLESQRRKIVDAAIKNLMRHGLKF